jgi:cob(I)alamin adenosyltransferase
MRIYTRTGDDGTTGLFGGARVRKDDPRVEAYGTVDELNAILGWARAADLSPNLDATLAEAQEVCFRLGAELATAPGKSTGLEPLDDELVHDLEGAIDAGEDGLATLKTFILPGGSEAAARLHVARTICRRAERALVSFNLESPVVPVGIRWLNRLSDFLFVAARRANHQSGIADVPWESRRDAADGA